MESTDGCYAAEFRASQPAAIFAGYIGSDIDITDLKRAQEEAFETTEAGELWAC